MKIVLSVPVLQPDEVIQSDPQHGPESLSVTRKIGNHAIRFNAVEDLAELEQGGELHPVWELNFGAVSDRGWAQFKATNDGHSVEVMRFVELCIREFLQRCNPEAIVVDCEKRREDFYERGLGRLLGARYRLNKWEDERNGEPNVHFAYTRKA